jgi:hypothetical protein
MENVGRSLEFEVVDLEVAAWEQQFAGIANQQADHVALLREPCSLPALVAVLQFDFEFAGTSAKFIDIAYRKHHP